MRDADFLAYLPVVASGDNANAIHYSNIFFQLDLLKLNLKCQNFKSFFFFTAVNSQTKFDRSDLILVDAGCDFGGYSSDITRTWPLSGKFNDYQKLIYEAVLDIQTQLISLLKEDAGKYTVDMLYRKMQVALGEKLEGVYTNLKIAI